MTNKTTSAIDLVERVARAISDAHHFACGLARPLTDAEATYLARKAIDALATGGLKEDIAGRLCKLHEKMLCAVKNQRPYPVSIRLGASDTDTVLSAAVEIERLRAAITEKSDTITRLRAALKPFAKAADIAEQRGVEIGLQVNPPAVPILLDTLRQAREAYRSSVGGEAVDKPD